MISFHSEAFYHICFGIGIHIAAQRSPLAASVRTTFIDQYGVFGFETLQNRPGYAGQLHGVVRRTCYPRRRT